MFALLMFIGFSTSMMSVPSTKASSINPHAYVSAYVDTTVTGVYTSITNDQEDLLHVNNTFITKEMWMPFNSTGTKWIEVGTTRGPINSSSGYISDWHGHFMAWADGSEYHERNFQTEYPTGTHNFQISRDSGTWTVYMDYTKVATVPHFDAYTTAVQQMVGIESNDNSNSFKSGTYASAMQFRNTSGTWGKWNQVSGTTIRNGTNDAGTAMGWSLSYSGTYNKLSFFDK
jgi:hypothetical protein